MALGWPYSSSLCEYRFLLKAPPPISCLHAWKHWRGEPTIKIYIFFDARLTVVCTHKYTSKTVCCIKWPFLGSYLINWVIWTEIQHLMILPRGTESSFVDLRGRIHALSSVNCEPQIAIRTNQTHYTILLGLRRHPENPKKLMLLVCFGWNIVI